MFFGTTPAPIRSFLYDQISRIQPKRVWEPCAGNFVVSQLCGKIDKSIEVISGDVSPYSVAIGYALLGQDSGIRIKADKLPEYPDLHCSNADPLDVGAACIILSELAKYLKKSHIRYYSSLAKDVMEKQREYMDAVRRKLESARDNLGRFQFSAVDCMAIVDQVAPGDFVFFDPPHFEGDYEKQGEALSDYIVSPEVPYTSINQEVRNDAIRRLSANGAVVYARPNEHIEIEGFERVFEYEYKTGARYYLYTNHRTALAQGRRELMKDECRAYDVIGPSDTFDETTPIALVPVTRSVANHFRLMWTKKAQMKDVGQCWLATAGGKVWGAVSIMSGEQFSHSKAVIIADCVSHASSYERLGKLLLHLILTNEFLAELNDRLMWQHNTFTTVAYTNAPVSMKYRGLFELVERKPGVAGYAHALVYHSKKLVGETIRDGYKRWLKTNARVASV